MPPVSCRQAWQPRWDCSPSPLGSLPWTHLQSSPRGGRSLRRMREGRPAPRTGPRASACPPQAAVRGACAVRQEGPDASL